MKGEKIMLKRYWKYKACLAITEKMYQNKQEENGKLLDTMIAMAGMGELTPRRLAFFMEALADYEIGEDDVQRYLLALSNERKKHNK